MNYVYQNYLTPELETLLTENPALNKFVRELHLYGLYAYDHAKVSESTSVYMCNTFGVHIAKVRIGRVEDKDGGQVDEYIYHSHWYSKQRGRSDNDRKTLRSVKLSSLMATIKRNDVIPDLVKSQTILTDRASDFSSAIEQSVAPKIRGYKPSHDLDSEVFHTFLKVYLGGESPDLLLRLDRSKLQKILNNYNEIDRAVAERKQAVQDKLLSEEMYAIGVTNNGDYLVSKFKVTPNNENDLVINVSEMKRVKSLIESNPEFIPLLTIHKAANENSLELYGPIKNNDNWALFNRDAYDSNLDMIFTSFVRGYDGDRVQWVVFPCSAI